MTYVVDTGVATLRHNQNHPGSVPVPTHGVPARPAPKNTFPEPEALLGSRETPRTRHARIRGPHHHHLPAGPPAPLDQLPLHRPDRGIRSRTRHIGFGQEPGLEIFHRDQLMRGHHLRGPDSAVVPILPGCLLVHLRRGAAGLPVSLRRRVALAAAASGHPTLGSRQLRRAPFPVPVMRQIEPFVAGGRSLRDTPVDPDTATLVGDRARHGFPGHHERGIQRLRVRAQHLLLRDLGTLAQPRRASPSPSQLFAQCRERRLPAGLLLVDGFVPQEPAAMPLLDQSAFGNSSRPQPVVVAHHLGSHAGHVNRPHRHGVPEITYLEGGRRFLSLVNDGVSAPNIR